LLLDLHRISEAIELTGYDNSHASVDGVLDSGVDGTGVAPTEGHRENGSCTSVVGNPLNTLNYARVGAAPISIQNLDTDNVDLLRDTVGASPNSTRAVSSVSVLIGVLF